MIRTDRLLMLWLAFAGLNSIQIVQGDLVAHWPLDEGSGDVFSDVAGGFDGFLPEAENGEPAEIQWSDEGPPHQATAVEFSGTNSFIATNYPGVEGSNPRTVAFWVKTTDANAYFLAWGSVGATEKWHIRTNGASGVLRTEFQSGQNFATTSVIDGEWHHVASVFPEGATEGEEILHYVDGVLDEQTGGTSQPINTAIPEGETDWTNANASEPYHVHFGGVLAHGFGRMLIGSMADVRIYDEELSEEQIRDIFEGKVGVGPRTPFAITDIDDSTEGSVTITWNSTNGRSYAVDSSTDLQEWIELGDGILSEGASTSFTDEDPAEEPTAGFYYRVREEE